MKYSIRKKTAFYIAILVMLAFLAGMSLCSIFASRYYAMVTENEMKSAYLLIHQLYEEQDEWDGLYGSVAKEYYLELSEICERNSFSMLVVSPSGTTAFSYGNTEILNERLTNLIFFPDNNNNTILEEGSDYTIQTVNGKDNTIKYLEMWGFLYDGCSFIFRCSYSGIQNNINVTMSFYLMVCACIFVIFAFILMILLRSFTVPLKRLAETAARVNEGDFDSTHESEKKRNDEIGVLSENVFEMAHKLEQTISELKTSNLNLKNELKTKEQIEEARKKYMSDVSHELKTPIALISGYAEGLKEGISESPEDRDYYCDVIIDEAEKMNLMVKKLSALNQLEQGKSAVTLERFNVVEVINGFLNTMSMIIEENEAKVYFNNADVVYVWSDEFLFEDVLVNYFNIALHHLDENKIIRINVEKVKENIRVTVFNSGSNIPEEELDKLWNKFYKVDKARTREYGGSGLGLSIVKAIADSLDKECGVYNMPDGVAFYIELEAADAGSSSSENSKGTAKNEKPERHSRLKLSEIPIWKGLKKKEKE